jgi:hypothetical protein
MGGGILMVCVIAGYAQNNERLSRLMAKVAAGPSVYYTDAARAFYRDNAVTPPADIPPEQTNVKEAVRAIRAAVHLGDMGQAAMPAVGVLVDKFPRIVHVMSQQGVEYRQGMGSFDDWLSTQMMSAKNTFLLSSQHLEYATMSTCERYITTDVHREFVRRDNPGSARISRAIIHMDIVIVLNAGYCALRRITGVDSGAHQYAWRQWLQQQGGAQAFSAGIELDTAALAAGGAGDEFIRGATYTLTLQTGDEYTATIDGMDDTSVVVTTERGEGLQIRRELIVDRELVEKPAETTGQPNRYTFEQLRTYRPTGVTLKVVLHGGKTFTGIPQQIEKNTLILDVNGNDIPIARDVIEEIVRPVGKDTSVQDSLQQQKEKGPRVYDSLYVKNPERDDYGRRLEDLLYVGTIVKDSASHVVFNTKNDVRKVVPYARITRRIDNTHEEKLSEIERYSQPLFCPEGMVLVDMPPGSEDKPFFKVCVDKYEYPNEKGRVPEGDVSYARAQRICREQDKRLCTVQEWQWACAGREGYAYPYGYNFDEDACNTEGIDHPEEAGAHRACVSKFGAYDMVGNKFEWVTGKDGAPMLMGGPRSKCQSVSSGAGGEAKPQTGFRCCKSN